MTYVSQQATATSIPIFDPSPDLEAIQATLLLALPLKAELNTFPNRLQALGVIWAAVSAGIRASTDCRSRVSEPTTLSPMSSSSTNRSSRCLDRAGGRGDF